MYSDLICQPLLLSCMKSRNMFLSLHLGKWKYNYINVLGPYHSIPKIRAQAYCENSRPRGRPSSLPPRVETQAGSEVIRTASSGRQQQNTFLSKLKQIQPFIPGEGDSHMKQTGMLVVSLRVVNFGFWSRLGCSAQSANILCRQGLGVPRRNTELREEKQKSNFLLKFSF